jgi:hypothetical protein
MTLGKASLKVFCAHLFFVFAGLALLYGDFNHDGLDQLHGIPAIALLAITFTALIVVATNEVKKKHAARLRRQEQADLVPVGAPSSRGSVAAESSPDESETADLSVAVACEPATITVMAKTSL